MFTFELLFLLPYPRGVLRSLLLGVPALPWDCFPTMMAGAPRLGMGPLPGYHPPEA